MITITQAKSKNLRPRISIGPSIDYRPGVLSKIQPEFLIDAIAMHMDGIWGDVTEDQQDINARNIDTGDEVTSIFHTPGGHYFKIQTISNQSKTIIELV